MYKIFEIDNCFEEYGISGFYTGAESLEDLVNHLPDIVESKRIAKKIIKDKWRIKEIEHLFTDTPYKYLTGYGYIE